MVVGFRGRGNDPRPLLLCYPLIMDEKKVAASGVCFPANAAFGAYQELRAFFLISLLTW